MPVNLDLRTRWIAAMRSSTTRAEGRECDYARAEGDADRFDPIGLLMLVAGHQPGDGEPLSPWVCPPELDGAWVDRHWAESIGAEVGVTPDHLYALTVLNDCGTPWSEMAMMVEVGDVE